jgi:alpha-D-ribose 1-methylphosphonate 5-phosphate C-P lyase
VSAALDGLLAGSATGRRGDNHAYLDETAKREVRRALLKALCIPGHQIPFASREMPVARGWGSGGLQVTLSVVVPEDAVKVIDQGDDDSLNAVGIRDLVTRTTGAAATTETPRATLIQTRHRIPEEDLDEEVVLVFQVPIADPLRIVDARPSVTRRMHAEGDYAGVWLYLYEDLVHHDHASFTHSHPVEVEGGYVMSPSPIPRHDLARLDGAPHISLFGAGREATVYAVPPYTTVRPLAFDDRPFETERFATPCSRCGSASSFRVECVGDGEVPRLVCSDTDWCRRRREGRSR